MYESLLTQVEGDSVDFRTGTTTDDFAAWGNEPVLIDKLNSLVTTVSTHIQCSNWNSTQIEETPRCCSITSCRQDERLQTAQHMRVKQDLKAGDSNWGHQVSWMQRWRKNAANEKEESSPKAVLVTIGPSVCIKGRFQFVSHERIFHSDLACKLCTKTRTSVYGSTTTNKSTNAVVNK